MRKMLWSLPLVLGCTIQLLGENWPQWRGPQGNGVSGETDLPVRWTEDDLLWKARITGVGVSSPVVWGPRIFVTSQLGQTEIRPGDLPSLSRGEDASERAIGTAADEESAQDRGDIELLVQTFNKEDGALLWEYRFSGEGPFPKVHNKHNQATPSCVTDGEGVYCWFGSGQLVALSLEGQLLWKRSLGRDYGAYTIDYGHGSSPVLYQDSILLLSDNSPSAYLLALDKTTGKEKWKTDRNGERRSFSTPVVIEVEGRDELIVNSSQGIDSSDPASGTILWSFQEPVRWPVPSPAFGEGVIFTSRGSRSGPYLALRPGGQGVVSESSLRWRIPTGAPYVSSLVYYEGIVYMVGDTGIVTATSGETGKVLWKTRLEGIYSASPVVADGKIYLTNEGGEVFVLNTGDQAKVVARNPIGGRCIGSPAVADGRIYFRTDSHLVSVGKK